MMSRRQSFTTTKPGRHFGSLETKIPIGRPSKADRRLEKQRQRDQLILLPIGEMIRQSLADLRRFPWRP